VHSIPDVGAVRAAGPNSSVACLSLVARFVCGTRIENSGACLDTRCGDSETEFYQLLQARSSLR
jgi:hypothetical protein